MTSAEIGRVIEERVLQKLIANPDGAAAVGKAVAIEIRGEGGGRWVVDCAKAPPVLQQSEDAAATAFIKMDVAVFEGLISGSLSPQTAFLSGKVRVEGDLGAAVRLGSLLI